MDPSWDWSPGKREILDTRANSDGFDWVEEYQASPDGENIAAIVKITDEEETLFGVNVNGETWENTYERAWLLRYAPNGKLNVIVSEDMEWTVATDGESWEEHYDFVWDMQFSAGGDVTSVAVQSGGEYGMSLNGTTWETLYENATNFVLSPCGTKSAAVVQTVNVPQADIDTFQNGAYSLAIDGEAWDKNFVNVWTPSFDAKVEHVASQIRLTLWDYTIAVDGKPWDKTYQSVWAPLFNASGDVIAPVRMGGKWGLAKNGQIIWDTRYFQCWHHQISADGNTIWAIVSPEYGRWTVAKNDSPWSTRIGGALFDMIISPDASRAVCLGKEGEKWAVVADDKIWSGWYDMAYKPVFSPDSQHIAVRVEKPGKRFTLAVDGKTYKEDFDMLWDPIFSPDGKNLLLRALQDGKYIRIVVPVNDI